jgi:hypothetical protein
MSPHALLEEVVRSHLKNLKLPAIARLFPEVAREAHQDGWRVEEFLRVLLEAELAQRAENVARERLHAARFPAMKTFEQFDFTFQPTLNREQLLRRAHGDWIAAAEPVLFAGPVGTGKTHLAIALGVEATRARHRVRFIKRRRPGAQPHRGQGRAGRRPAAGPTRTGRRADPKMSWALFPSTARGPSGSSTSWRAATNTAPRS